MSLTPSESHTTNPSWERSSRAQLAREPVTHAPNDSSTQLPINVSSGERFLSALAGGLAIAWGLSNRTLSGKAVAALGGGLIYRGVSGHCHVYQALGVDSGHHDEPAAHASSARKIDVLRSVTVQQPAEVVFRAWRQPETFARAMSHFASHTALEGNRTLWTLHDPIRGEHSWVTEVVAEEPGKKIRWQTVERAPLLKNLTLELRPAPGTRGTEMTLHLRLEPQSRVLGAVLTKLFGKAPAWVLDRALGNVKALLEAGEVPSLKFNPAARASAQL